MYIAMLDHPLFGKFDFRSLRTGIMSGSACPVHRMQQAQERMFMREITNPYGLTEAGPVMTMTRYFEPSIERKCQTIGQALPGIEVAIIDPETGDIAPVGTDGEICCRGYNNMKGYYNMPEQTAKCIDANGWLHSGDIGRMDQDGYYYITGRLKDLIIRGGENISPKEVAFEVPVKLGHVSFIDAFIAENRVLIEQKGSDIDLCKGYKQSDGSMLSNNQALYHQGASYQRKVPLQLQM